MGDSKDISGSSEENISGFLVSKDRRNNIQVLNIAGEITDKQQLLELYTYLLLKTGILDTPEAYLLRNVRKAMLGKVVQEGCERNEHSYRDKLLEQDFKIRPEDYTYCHSFDGSLNEYLRHAIYNPEGTALVVYNSSGMIPHNEARYDRASSLGLGPTSVTFEFKEKSRKTEAIKLIVNANFKNLDDMDWQ